MHNPNQVKNELTLETDFKQYFSSCSMESDLFISPEQIISIEDISGNINRVKRVELSNHKISTLILKHVPYGGRLAKYPTIIFSSDRLEYEYDWFNKARTHLEKAKIESTKVPKIYHFDKDMRLIIMEDLGIDSLSCHLATINASVLNSFGTTIGTIHNLSRIEPIEQKANQAASQNRPFIFSFHITNYEDVIEIWKNKQWNSTDLKLNTRIELLKDFIDNTSGELLPKLAALETAYKKTNNPSFTHGDLHTKSIIKSIDNKLGIIDAELADYGDGAFDIGFLMAHIIAESSQSKINRATLAHSLLDGYLSTIKSNLKQVKSNTISYCGAEMLRRLFGPAGFNTEISLDTFQYLQQLSYNCLTEPDKILKQLTQEKI